MSVAIRAITRIQDGDDVNVSLGAGVDEYALCWDQDTARFVLRAMSAGVTDHGALTGLSDDDHSQYLLATGARTGASSQAQTFTNGIISPSWKPASDSTTALKVQNAAGNADILTVDTTNSRVGIGATPTAKLTIKSGSTAYENLALSVLDSSSGSIFGACDDGRVYVGAKSTYDTAFEVNNANFTSTGGYLLALRDGSKDIQFSTTAITSNQPDFSFGANANGAAIAMFSPLNYGLVVWGNQAAINRQGPYAPTGQFDVYVDTATRAGVCVFAKSGQSANLTNWYAADTTVLSAVSAAGWFGAGTSTPATLIHALLTSAATNAVTDVLTIGHTSSGTVDNGFGAGQLFTLKSSTAVQSAARIQALWYEATHATRKADLVLTAYDTSEREGLRIRGAGSEPSIGFYGVAPIARAVLATGAGATVDNVITALQNLGLVKQS